MEQQEKINENELQELVKEICDTLSSEGNMHITFRDIEFELSYGSDKVNALKHGKNQKIESYYHFFEFLFHNRGIEMNVFNLLDCLREILENDEDIVIARMDRHTHRVVSDWKFIVKHNKI